MKIAHSCAAHAAEQHKHRLDALGGGAILLQRVFRADAEDPGQGPQELLREALLLAGFQQVPPLPGDMEAGSLDSISDSRIAERFSVLGHDGVEVQLGLPGKRPGPSPASGTLRAQFKFFHEYNSSSL
jgi:hypothetical protein